MSELIDVEIATIEEELAKAKDAVDRAIDLRDAYRRKLHDARNRKHGLVIGRTIIRQGDKEYLISNTRYFGSSGRPSVDARKRLKSGGWHKTSSSLWGSWEVVGELPADEVPA